MMYMYSRVAAVVHLKNGNYVTFSYGDLTISDKVFSLVEELCQYCVRKPQIIIIVFLL